MSLLFDESLQKIKFLFQLSGIPLDHTTKNTFKDILKYRWLYILNFCWLNTDIIGEIIFIIEGAQNGEKLVELTYVMPCTVFCILGDIKCMFLVFNEATLNLLFKNLRKMEETKSDNKRRDEIVNEEKSFLWVVITALNFFNALTVISFLLNPFFLMGLEYKRSGKFELILPFPIWYPFDKYDMKFYPLVYFHQCWSAFVIILGICAVDTLFYVCCTSIRTQFRLLQLDIECIIPETGFNEKIFEKNFRTLIIRHQEIMRSVNLLEIVYTKATLFNFMSSSFLICLTGFNTMAVEDVAFMLTFMMFMIMSSLQIYLLCFFGDMMMTSSMDVSNAIYNSKWYTVNAKSAKFLFLSQIRAQKPCKLTAASYADVNLRAFTRILSTAWSYFALLKTVYSSHRG